MPGKDRKFVNPLTQPSTPSSTFPTTDTPTYPATYTSTSYSSPPRFRGEKAFEHTHECITLWLDKGLKSRFEVLADEEGIAKSTLLDEAIEDLLTKREK